MHDCEFVIDNQQAKTHPATIRCDDAAMKRCSTNLNVKSKQSSGIDRISSLADELLIHILSFLPTNKAIVTSILSRRWRHVYTWIPNLEFDTSPLLNDCLNCPQNLAFFVNHVKNVLQANQCKDLTKFHLKIGVGDEIPIYYPDLKPSLLRQWISYSLLRRVKELDLKINAEVRVELPKDVFSSETLEVLNLVGKFHVELPKKFCLPKLKVCHLESINFAQGGFLGGLLSGCPCIEDLTMRNCRGGRDLKTIHISSSSLKILVIVISPTNIVKKLVLETHNLQHLEYVDEQLAQDYSIGNLNLLVKASINISGFVYGCLKSMLKLLRPLSNVRNLTVEGSWLRVPKDAELPVFRNLEHLTLTLPDRKNWRKGLLELLSCSPSLETLHVPGPYQGADDDDESSWVAAEEIPPCLRFHLKKIVIEENKGFVRKLQMVEYFLRNASVLQVLEVAFHNERLSENALKKLPRASMNCSIKVRHQSLSPAMPCVKITSSTPCDGASMKPCLINSIPKSMHPSGIDRISNLADELLVHILSFLPTNEAIVTSILSRRWRHIYTWIPNLEFDTSPINDCLNYPPILACFVTHVKNVLRTSQCKALTKFHLKIRSHDGNSSDHYPTPTPDVKPKLLEKWILYSLLRRVKELDLNINAKEKVKLPKEVFSSETLEVLKLDGNLDVKFPKKFCFPNLKVCHLKSMYFPQGHFLCGLISDCPSIEDLTMKSCSAGYNSDTLFISSTSIRILVVDIRVSYYPYSRSNVVLETPNQQHLKYVDYRLAEKYSTGNLSDLVKASIYITDGQKGSFETMFNLLSSLSNVRYLTLRVALLAGMQETEGVELESLQLPVFRNLEHLKLTLRDYTNWRKGLLMLLTCSPYLKTLTVTGTAWGASGVAQVESSWGEAEEIPSCLRFHLEKIVIRESKRLRGKLEMVEYFLKNASVLEELEVPFDHERWSETALKKLPRASLNCSIKVRKDKPVS